MSLEGGEVQADPCGVPARLARCVPPSRSACALSLPLARRSSRPSQPPLHPQQFWVHSAPLSTPCTLELEAVTGAKLTLTTPDPYKEQKLGGNFA